ncbi:14259_t:CDS:2, partial [Cetraspora pellucida]
MNEVSLGGQELPDPDQRGQNGFQWKTVWKTSEAINLIVGTGIFITPGSIWRLVQSPGAALILWIVGGFINLYSFFVWRLMEKKQLESLAYGFTFGSRLLRFFFAIIANSLIASKYLLYAIGGVDDEEFHHYGKDFGAYFDKDF